MQSANMRSSLFGFLGAAAFWALAHSGPALAQIQVAPAFLRLQATTPGVQQSGHANVSGTVIAGQFQGGGSALTGVDAAKLGGQSASAYGLLAGSNTWSGVDNFTNAANTYAGSGTLLTGLNATNLSSGTVPDARLNVGGDLTGPLSNAKVSKLQGKQLLLGGAFTDSVIKFDGSNWIPGEDGLTLPGGGAISHVASAFGITNTGTGQAITTMATGGGNSLVAVAGNSVATLTDGNGVYANSMVNNGYGLYATGVSPADGAARFSFAGREVVVGSNEGAIVTNGFLWKEYTPGNLGLSVPIAYGSVSATGAINGGTNTFTVVHSGTGTFDITVNNEVYNNNTYVVTVTPLSNSDRHACVADVGTPFRVNMFTQAGALVDNAFQFTVWAFNPTTSG